MIEALRRKVADIEALEARLAQSKVQLVAIIRDIEAKPGDMDCTTNARLVLSCWAKKSSSPLQRMAVDFHRKLSRVFIEE